MTQPYVPAGEGRSYSWHDVVFTIKAAGAETGGALAIWEVTTSPGEEPQPHVHEVDEIFYLLSGRMTFVCGEESFAVTDGWFVFIPRGVTHTYSIHSPQARLLGLCTPSTFADNIERTGEPIDRAAP